ncbi:dihydropteroate synthase [Roseobacter sp. HKCCA0434]|uniref:dihydropteroate synthase n=1 Tax=Roseobacter sp. HKCCA0434 TaxID=3079297 RepID=UPI002905966D|nr:dihydropteroate synthase [Roseobacter sp. HKCCA0434]
MTRARPLVQSGPRPPEALPLAGGALWFAQAELLHRDAPSRIVPARDLPDDLLDRLTSPRTDIAGLPMDRPQIMGILNVTPDSFSDGGRHEGEAALARARQMVADGAAILDIGGESTRPGAATVPEKAEIARVLPVIEAVRGAGLKTPISIDTRKAEIARRALDAGADLFNDVSALSYDVASLDVAVASGAPVCLMHAQGDPRTMQDAPRYDDVLLDVYDWLADRIANCEAAGLPRSRIVVDPGIGFGKTLAHNLALLRGLSLFHGLGCPILLGASRKRFIGTIGGADAADARDPGSHAVMLDAARQGAQILRVHDTAGAAQSLALWRALTLEQESP